MCVPNTRVIGRCPSGPAIASDQAAAVSGLCSPVSTAAQPAPSAIAQVLMCDSGGGSGLRIHSRPGVTSTADPCTGAAAKG